MQVIFRHFDILSFGIFVGPAVVLIGLFLLKKMKRISKILIALGSVYFLLSAGFIWQFVEGEKRIIQLRERAKEAE